MTSKINSYSILNGQSNNNGKVIFVANFQLAHNKIRHFFKGFNLIYEFSLLSKILVSHHKDIEFLHLLMVPIYRD